MNVSQLSRRRFLHATAGLLGAASCAWLPRLAAAAAPDPRRKRSCILLWMAGGPSQTDTFDLKPGHANGGPFKEVETRVPGLRFSQHLPKLAQQADRLAILRGVSTKEGGPPPRHLPDAYRSTTWRAVGLSGTRRLTGQGLGEPRGDAAQLRGREAPSAG